MTAQELYEIVKDVPREAWPTTIQPDCDFSFLLVDERQYGPCGGEILEAAFVGAMVRYLPNVEIRYQSHENSVMLYTVTVTIGWEDRWFRAPLLVEALAAACKQKREDDDGN